MNSLPKYITSHSMFAQYDYEYLRNKGYSNREIKAFWDRNAKRGCTPITKAAIIPDFVGQFKN